MASRIDEYMKKQDAALLEDTASVRERAFHHDYPRVKDYSDVPCSKRVGIIRRKLDRLSEERDHTKFRLDRVTEKLRIRLGHGNVEPILAAQDNLSAAIEHLNTIIKAARTVRKHSEKACKVPRKRR